MADWRQVSVEREKSIYSKEQKFEVGNHSATSWYTNSRTWRVVKDSGVGH